MSIPATIGEYRVERLLGRGGMASVYLATGPRGRVALKWLHRPDPTARFASEVRILGRLRHPHVVRTLGGGVGAVGGAGASPG